MQREGHDSADFFVGTEVEHSPAYGMKTLFVVGVINPQKILRIVQDSQALLDKTKHITHVYFGANQSFPQLKVNDSDGWRPWEHMIKTCLESGVWCTLDFDVGCAEGILESFLVEHDRFIPMISVKLPYIRQFGYNATLKLDDKDFAGTNPGVWCHSLHELQNRKVFTDWSKYSQDEVIK
jgi:hypothetical protein